MSTPGVVLVAGFALPNNVKQSYFENAQDYLGRKEAKEGEIKPDTVFNPKDELKTTYNGAFYKYHEYMNDAEKTTGLFDAYDDELTRSKKKFYERKFAHAYNQKGVMWIPVISFDNGWLEEQGVLNKCENTVDGKQLKVAVRKSVTHLLKSENLLGNAYWTAAIHYNTDNIHIHVSIVEKIIKRERGKMLLSNIDKAKTKIVSSIVDRTSEMTLINDLMRDKIINRAKELEYRHEFSYHIKQVANIEKRQYGRLSNQEKERVDNLSKLILKYKFPNEYNEYNQRIATEMNFYKRAYGSGERHLYQDYQKNKEKELFIKIGNSILKQGELYRQEQFKKGLAKKRDKYEQIGKKIERNKERIALNKELFSMKKMMWQVENETQKAIAFYEQMVREVDYGKDGS